jgi:hypothetical protein
MSDSPVCPATSTARTLPSLAAFGVVLSLLLTYFILHLAPVGEISERNWALCDFRDAVYYPCRSVRDGVNPYDVDAHLRHCDGKVGNIFPLYSPLVLLLHFPLAYLPFHVAGAVYLAVQIAFLFVVVTLTLRWCGWQTTIASVFGLAALVLLSQPGQTNFNFGQVTWPLVLGSYLALSHSRDKPLLAGLALALASYKPTYAVPIGFFLLCRGDWRAVGYGVLFAIVGAMAGLGLMAAHGIDVFETLNVVLSNQATLEADPAVDPATTSIRVDVPVFLAKLFDVPNDAWLMRLAPSFVLLTTAWLVWRETRQPSNLAPNSFATFMLCLGAVVGMYRIVYDLVFLTLPVVALFTASHPSWRRLPTRGLTVLRVLAVVLALNCLWTGPAIRVGYLLRENLPEQWLPSVETTWHVAQTLNPFVLVVIWGLALAMYLRSLERRIVPSQVSQTPHSPGNA